jgi:hypothetical protein
MRYSGYSPRAVQATTSTAHKAIKVGSNLIATAITP